MSLEISVNNLSKQYGQQFAVNSISFSVKPGEILGLLGPNGAGKSTTMKMLTGYIQPSSGEISICGSDPSNEPMKVKQNTGYLPEHNPLYKDLYIREYLQWLGRLHSVDHLDRRVSEVIELVGLGPESHKKIGQLSKGYRQRVGLAQAIIHDPDVLILDEPTTGLDPNQLIEIRALIQSLGQEKILIFSSHIMQEVQVICDRVLIMNQGEIVADKAIDQLAQSLRAENTIHVRFEKDMDQSAISDIASVIGVKPEKNASYEIQHSGDGDQLCRDIFDLAVDRQNRILQLTTSEESMEEIFTQLTKALNT